ncbi:hypothetical protein [Oceanobacillus salinisoli]|uniref:hypothetical protein n=1 Tax=Oceanobacillus salinisoli TaxID=2678611 RepID=UPI0012E30B0C|nr:hypothetical protein [Oceanobacillus salinisoli]
MGKESKSFRCWNTNLSVPFDSDISHPTMKRLLEMMQKRGWKIQTDQRILEEYPILADDHFEGRKGDLKFKAEKYPAGFNFEFFQDINVENTNGGYYDFDKFEKMPYLIKLRFLLEKKYMIKLLDDEGYSDGSESTFKYAYEEVMHRIKSCCHYKEGKELPDFEIEEYNAKDKDGKILKNGQVKYFRDRKGRLQRGVIYHNINNMWWTILNKYEFTNIASFYFFDLDTEENRKRKLVKPSGKHNPKSRSVPDENQIEKWKSKAKKSTKQERITKANGILDYLYSLNLTSRNFQFYLKTNGRVGLKETESRAWGIHKKFEEPIELPLYTRTLPMSSTESSWVKGLREYVVHGKPGITQWFCTDHNGEGSTAYKWPEVREKLWKIGALAS